MTIKARDAVLRAMSREAPAVDLDAVADLVRFVCHAACDDSEASAIRTYNLDCVHLREIRPGEIRAEAADGHRFAVGEATVSEVEIGLPVRGLTLAPHAVAAFQRVRGAGTVPILAVRDALLTVYDGGLVAFGPLRSAWPDLGAVIPPRPEPARVSVATDDALHDACARAHQYATFSHVDSASGARMECTLQSHYVREALVALGADEVEIWWPKSQFVPVVLRPAGDAQRLCGIAQCHMTKTWP